MKDVQTDLGRHWPGLLLLLIGWLCLPGTALLQAQEPRSNELSRTRLENFHYATQHFFVRGGTYLQNVEVGNWAEQILRMMEAELNKPFPARKTQPIRIQIDNQKETPRVFPAQQNLAGDLVQRLHVHRVAEIDDEDLLESLCFLLCSRYVMAEALANGRRGINPKPPEWFTTGLAQYIIHDLRDRDRRYVIEDWKAERGPMPYDLIKHEVFEEGRKSEKASCAMFIAFLRDQTNFQDMLTKMFVTWSMDRKVDEEWFNVQLIKVKNRREMHMEWDLWLAWHARKKTEIWDVPIRDQIAGLKKLMKFRPRELGIAGYPFDQVSETSWRDLMNRPRDKWQEEMVSQLLVRVSLLGLGQPESFRNVIKEFTLFLQELTPSVPVGDGPPREPTMKEKQVLAQLLGTAQRSLVAYEARINESESLLDLVDQEPASAKTTGTFPTMVPELPDVEPELSDNPTPEEFQELLRWLEAQKKKEEGRNVEIER